MIPRRILAAVLAVVALSSIACQTKEERAAYAIDRGERALSAGDLVTAESAFREALESMPGIGGAVAGLARVTLRKQGPDKVREILGACADEPCSKVRREAASVLRARLATRPLTDAEATTFAVACKEAATSPACGVLEALASLEARRDRKEPIGALAAAIRKTIEDDAVPVSDSADVSDRMGRAAGEGAGNIRTCKELADIELRTHGRHMAMVRMATGVEPDNPLAAAAAGMPQHARSALSYYALCAVYDDIMQGPVDKSLPTGPLPTWPPKGPECEKLVACCMAMSERINSALPHPRDAGGPLMICPLMLDQAKTCVAALPRVRTFARGMPVMPPECAE
jgi:hypothetical protein